MRWCGKSNMFSFSFRALRHCQKTYKHSSSFSNTFSNHATDTWSMCSICTPRANQTLCLTEIGLDLDTNSFVLLYRQISCTYCMGKVVRAEAATVKVVPVTAAHRTLDKPQNTSSSLAMSSLLFLLYNLDSKKVGTQFYKDHAVSSFIRSVEPRPILACERLNLLRMPH